MFLQQLESYLNQSDWRVKENANMPYSFSNLLMYAASSAVSEYALQRIYKNHPIVEMHREGKVHIHDLSGGIAPYCAGWSLKQLLDEGFNIPDSSYIASKPAKHFRSAISHMLNFLGTLSNEWLGAQAFSDVDVYLAPYIYADYIMIKEEIEKDVTDPQVVLKIVDRLIRKEVKQTLQELLYNLNFPSRWGGQSPFTNFTLALTVPNDLENQSVAIAGKFLTDEENKTITYGKLGKYINLFNELFFSVYIAGTGEGKVFTFPIITVNVTDKFFKLPQKVLNLILTSNKKYGATYFQNCIAGQSNLKPIKPETVRSMCCRLTLDLDDLAQHAGGLFGNGEMTGSIGVVTVNLPEIGYIAKGDAVSFFSILSEWMKLSAESLLLKKEEVLKNFERGLFPYTKRYLKTKFRTHFLTIGYIGLHEAIRNFGIEEGIMSKEGKAFAIQVLDFMREKIVEFQKEHKTLFNLEAAPAEGASFRMATETRKRIPDLLTAGEGEAIYFTNSCHPPVQSQGDLVALIKHQEDLQSRHTGGTVVHFYLDGQPEEKTILNLIKKICSSKLPYFTLSTVFSYCPVHGYLPGKHDTCPYPHTEDQIEKYGIDRRVFFQTTVL